MNFLSEIMATAGKIEMDELRNRIHKIKEDISTLKLKVNDLVEREYIQFIPLLQEEQGLTSEAVTLAEEMEEISHRIETQVKAEVTECLDEVVTLSESFKESKIMLHVLNKLLYMHGVLQSLSDIHYEERRSETVKKLIEVRDFLEETAEDYENLEIVDAIRTEIDEQWREYVTDNLKLLSNYVTWEERDCGIKSKQVILNVSEKLSGSDLLEALYLYDELALATWHFCDLLTKRILEPIMMSPHSVSISINEGAQLIVQSEAHSNIKSDTSVKMENLLKVFQFISEYLNMKIDEEKTFVSKIDDQIAENFCELFIKNCVLDSIPFKQKDYQDYENFMRQVVSFESALRKMGFLLNKSTALSNFASNSDEHFSDKASQVYLSKARELMKCDLHRMMQVSPPALTSESIAKLNDSLYQHVDLCDDLLQFPSCSISKSTSDLMDILTEIMEDIVESTSVLHAVKLFSAARNIVSMYSDVVPIYHAKLLASIPQQAALFYNNCFYLAHMSVFLVFEFKRKFPETLDSYLVTLVDLVQPLRKTGLAILTEQQQIQKNQIVSIIKDSGLITLGDTSVFPVSIEKSIRQCLRQLKLLKSVWQQVLPVSTYIKLIGSISSTFVEELIKCILSLDDIAADVATKLVSIFNIIIEELPLVFPNSNEVYRLIKKWGRFVELNNILGGTLQQIDERWTDGKGPLAVEFKPEQVRRLIRALFRDTERRANVLAKIQIQVNTS